MLETGTLMVALGKPRGFLALRRFAGVCAIYHSIQLDKSYRFHISFCPGKPLEKEKNAKNWYLDGSAREASGVSESQKVCGGLYDTPFDSA
jgi:hypothetical protein